MRLMHCTASCRYLLLSMPLRRQGNVSACMAWAISGLREEWVCKAGASPGRMGQTARQCSRAAAGSAPRCVRLVRRQRDQALEGQEHAGGHVLCQLVPVRHLDLCSPAQAWMNTVPSGCPREHAGRCYCMPSAAVLIRPSAQTRGCPQTHPSEAAGRLGHPQ